jgi:hypothetical protein
MFNNLKRRFLKNSADIHKKENGAFSTQAISQKDDLQEGTNVSLPSDENVNEARRWVAHNKK